MTDKKVVYVVYYSMHGHVSTMAKQIMVGLDKAGGIKFFLKYYFYY